MPARSGPLRAPSNAGSVHRAGRDRRGRQTGRTKRWRQRPFSRGADRPAPRHGAARPRQPKVMRFRRFRALCAELFAAAEARPAAGAGVSGATVPAGSGRRGSTAARSAGRRRSPVNPPSGCVRPSGAWTSSCGSRRTLTMPMRSPLRRANASLSRSALGGCGRTPVQESRRRLEELIRVSQLPDSRARAT